MRSESSMSHHDRSKFRSEAELCRAFITQRPEGWTAYPETGGFDILMVRDADGAQIGIEAKLRLNSKVVEQIAVPNHWHYSTEDPDFRAVLVPWGASNGLAAVCRLIGVTVIEMRSKESYVALVSEEASKWGRYRSRFEKFRPDLPEIKDSDWYYWRLDWHDWCPPARVSLPEYVPDVGAGHSAPVQLSFWKIAAIKLCIVLERRGYVTAADFKHFKLSPSRWTQHFLERGTTKGQYVAGRYTPDYRPVHPVNFAQIEADFQKWAPDDLRENGI